MSAGLFVVLTFAAAIFAAGSAIFSAIETSLFSLQPFHIERLRAKRAEFAASLAKLLENPRRLLSSILLADALVNLPLIIICIFLLRHAAAPQLPFWAKTLLIFALVVFACDLLPKLLALAQPYRVAKTGVQVLGFLMPVFDPMARVLQRLSEQAADAITPEALKKGNVLSEEELETLVELSAEEGALHETESEMIQEIIKLGDKTARDCMTPRVDAFAIPDDLENSELLPQLRARRYRRVPVYGETPDDIVGILDVRAFLMEPDPPHYSERITPPSFVAETMKAIDLLKSFLSHRQEIAIVVDEHGGTEGLITLADIVEEIISDAVPRAERELYMETIGVGRLIVNGSARLDDISELLGITLEEGGIDTIGGLIFNRLGSMPKPGTQIHIEGLVCTVRRSSRKRVEEVLIECPPSDTADTDGDSEEDDS
jgi:putative hemolysin